MPDREYRSKDKRFGVSLPETELERMLGSCKKAKGKETGGVVVGSYSANHDYALVKTVSKAPKDSKAGHAWFSRGVRGLQRWLDKLWKSKSFYLGEWHFHPFAAPDPSRSDMSQMFEIAEADSCKCPEPILLILGGDPEGAWAIRAFVFRRGHSHVELFPVASAAAQRP
jgi:integrative and conjugative element protein (TIGR02256 family)